MSEQPEATIVALFGEPKVQPAPAEYERWELTEAGSSALRAEAVRAGPDELERVTDALSLQGEIEQLRALLREAIIRARETPPKDPILAVTRLMAALARAVQLQRALDEGKPDALDAMLDRVLDELDAHDLALAESHDAAPRW